MMRAMLLVAFAATASAFQLQSARVTKPRTQVSMGPVAELRKLSAAATAFSIATYIQAAEAKSVLGVNGALDFGKLAGDQPGGEGTGKALGVNDDSLFVVLGGVTLGIGLLFAQWQSYQDDDDDFFDSYDSRRSDYDPTNRNRV